MPDFCGLISENQEKTIFQISLKGNWRNFCTFPFFKIVVLCFIKLKNTFFQVRRTIWNTFMIPMVVKVSLNVKKLEFLITVESWTNHFSLDTAGLMLSDFILKIIKFQLCDWFGKSIRGFAKF